MSILYHVTAPPPRMQGTDAVFQEVEALQQQYGGDLNYLYPFRRPGIPLPPKFFGLHNLWSLRRREKAIDLHHVFANAYLPFPMLRFLRKPVVYTVVASVQGQQAHATHTHKLADRIVVTNQRDLDVLQDWGFPNGQIIRPGIDVDHYEDSEPPSNGFTILAGSAPWVEKQFEAKGFEAMFEVVQRSKDLRLILLWRGLLVDKLHRRLKAHGIEDRVDVINERADVSQLMQRAHAAIVLADRPRIIKSYPHSLIEALAAGRPVLLSECIPMADYVVEKNCGAVVADLSPANLEQSISDLRGNYAAARASAVLHGKTDFAKEQMVAKYGTLYRELGYA